MTDNVADFVQYNLIRMAEQYAKEGRADIADAMYNALEAYAEGTVDIVFHDGMPYMQAPENIDDCLTPSVGEIDPEESS